MTVSLLTTEVFVSISFNDTVINGIEFSSMIFIFVGGLNSFKETFRMFLQNGRSRRTLFLSYLYSLLPVTGIMALVDTSLGTVGSSLGNYRSIFEPYFLHLSSSSSLVTFLAGLGLCLFFYTTCALMGYFITTLYYRMGKGLKLLVSIGVPTLVIIVLPMVDIGLAHGAISRGIGQLFLLASGIKAGYNPFYPLASCLIVGSILAGLTYLLQRRAVIKEQV